MPVEYSVVHVDQTGYRVAGSVDVFDDRTLARGVVEVARGAVDIARGLRRGIYSITVSWDGGVIVVKVRDGEVVAVILEEAQPQAPATVDTRATAQA